MTADDGVHRHIHLSRSGLKWPSVSFEESNIDQIDKSICNFGKDGEVVFAHLISRALNKDLLFDTLVTLAMHYGVQIWGPSVDHHSRAGQYQWMEMHGEASYLYDFSND